MTDIKGLLESERKLLENDLENQKLNEADADEAQKIANKALNDYLHGREAYYEQEKTKIKAIIGFIDGILNKIK